MLTSDLLTSIFNSFAFALDMIGVIITIAGGLIAIYRYVVVELSRLKHHKKRPIREELRAEFGQRIVLGLEFFLAGDIIRTIITPSWDGLGRLAAIVSIRTVLSYFLLKEIDRKKK